jgi:hypothetical protein
MAVLIVQYGTSQFNPSRITVDYKVEVLDWRNAALGRDKGGADPGTKSCISSHR